MSISTELTRLARNVGALTADTNAIFEALRAKGVNVPADAQLSDVAEMIENIVIPHQNEVEIGGRWYPYVQIGNQLWLAENLDYKFSYNGSTLPIGLNNLPSTPAAWYYNNDESAYGIDGTYKCGMLYNWYAAKYLDDNKSTLLPDGWKVPSKDDWDILAIEVGGTDTAGTKLKANDNSITSIWPSGWNGTDNYGFSAIPSGDYYGNFREFGIGTNYWSTDVYNSDRSVVPYLRQSASLNYANNRKTDANSLRLVRTIP